MRLLLIGLKHCLAGDPKFFLFCFHVTIAALQKKIIKKKISGLGGQVLLKPFFTDGHPWKKGEGLIS